MQWVAKSNAEIVPLSLSQLARHMGMAGTQTTVHSPRLTIDITTLVTTEEERNTRDLIRTTTASSGVNLANFLLAAACASCCVHGFRHARLDETRADGVDANACAAELVRNCLRERDDGCFGC